MSKNGPTWEDDQNSRDVNRTRDADFNVSDVRRGGSMGGGYGTGGCSQCLTIPLLALAAFLIRYARKDRS